MTRTESYLLVTICMDPARFSWVLSVNLLNCAPSLLGVGGIPIIADPDIGGGCNLIMWARRREVASPSINK